MGLVMIIKTLFIVSLLLLLTSNYTNAQDENYWEGKVRIINPGPPLNLDDIDYAPYVSQDGKYMFFSTKRKGNYKSDDGTGYSHDVWLAVKSNSGDSVFSQVFNICPPEKANTLINTMGNEGAVCISSDKKLMYLNGCNRKEGMGSCDIYVAPIQIIDNEINIGNLYGFESEINTKLFEANPSISHDNLKLYFDRYVFGTEKNWDLSNKQNRDIYFSEYDTINKIWQMAKPLTGVNTPEDEMMPYICPDNKTLIFVSKGRRDGIGGMDFYYTILDSNGEWSKPKNLGKPFNSTKDDIYISFNGTGEFAYFSSDRTDIPGRQGKDDIYMAYLSEPFFKEVRTISWQQFSDANVMIDIYDSSGNPVNTINQGLQKSGRHSFQWDGLDNKGKAIPSGVYQFEVTIGNEMPEPPRVLRIK